MPPIKFITLVYCSQLVLLILSLNKIMPTCFYCIEKGLVYIVIIAFFNRQPSSCTKYTYINI